ncbi:hypothetical protein VTI74DRAFT_3070 [Chaetomium olivicolor]
MRRRGGRTLRSFIDRNHHGRFMPSSPILPCVSDRQDRQKARHSLRDAGGEPSRVHDVGEVGRPGLDKDPRHPHRGVSWPGEEQTTAGGEWSKRAAAHDEVHGTVESPEAASSGPHQPATGKTPWFGARNAAAKRPKATFLEKSPELPPVPYPGGAMYLT